MAHAGALPWRVPGFAAMAARVPPPGPRPLPPPAASSHGIRDRDPHTWRLLFEREMPAIYRYAYSRLADATRAEDATAEVFEEAWQGAGGYEDRGLPPRAWLFGIARNVVNTHRRRWFRQPPQVALEAFDGPAAEPATHDQIDLARAIASLEPSHAEVINLRFIQDLSLQETADALGVSVDAVKGRQARALQALREKLGAA